MKTITIRHFYRRADGNTLLIHLFDTWWQHGWPIDHNAVDPPFVCAAPTLDVPRTRRVAQHAGVTPCPFASSQNLSTPTQSCCHRLDGRANSAEARQEQSCRAVAFGGDPRHGTVAAGSRTTRRGSSGSSITGCISGRTAHWVWSPPPLSISLGLTPGTTGFSPLQSC
jgi:hypothetical protein